MLYLYIVLFLALLPGIVLFAAGSYTTNTNRPYELLAALEGVSQDMRDAARECFQEAASKARSILAYDVTAPYVMLLVLPFISRDANVLPSWLRKWDNERSMNGDGWGKLVDGKWVTFRTTNEPNCIPYTDPAFQGVAYYVQFLAGIFPESWLTPRSFIARYVWLGIRNRASMSAVSKGCVITDAMRNDVQYWGELNTGAKTADGVVIEGTMLLRAGNYFELYSVNKKGSWLQRTRYGYKLTNALDARNNTPIAMVTAMGVSYKRA